jgi:proteasome accessory factor A
MQTILGTETEFGIATRDPNVLDPVSNSIFLINQYPRLPSPDAIWDYENENPLLDLRGFEVEGERERPGPAYNRLLNKLLLNGGRLYVDGAHPEYSTPECTHPRQVVLYEKVGERILEMCRGIASQMRGQSPFYLYKNNTDGKGNSYGYHENYLLSRSVPFEQVLRYLTPFLVTRQIYAGAGKVGSENRTPHAGYQISQRADFFETPVDLNTMVKRPIINTRDEPHADPKRYRRLHVIVGDANMSETTTYLKVGATLLVVWVLEAGGPLPEISFADPVETIKQVSRDLTLKGPLRLSDGRTLTAVEIQSAYREAVDRFFASRGRDPMVSDILRRWEEVLKKLSEDPRLLAKEIDWVIKRELIGSYLERKGSGWDDPRAKLMDLQYHDIRLDKGLYYSLERSQFVERLLTDDEVVRAEEIPPADTRAYFRSMCLKKYAKSVYAASWSSVLFDVGNTTIKRVPLMEPLRGTETMTGELFQRSATVEELLKNLTG